MEQTAITGKIFLGALYVSIVVAILAMVIVTVSQKVPAESRVFIGGQEIVVSIADTKVLREKGLSGHKNLKLNEGMLFMFPKPGNYGFWMKDMLFPVDVIWLDAHRKIIDVWERAEPVSYPKIVTPRAPAQFVLEVPAGFFNEHHLNVGDILEIL